MTLEQHDDGLFYVTFRTMSGTDETICTNKDTLEGAQKVVADAKIAEIEAASEARILSAQVVGRILTKKSPTVRDAFEEYVEWMEDQSTYAPTVRKDNETSLRCWMETVGLEAKQVALLEPADVSKFVNMPSDRKLTTRIIILSRIKSFLNYCSHRGYCFMNPASVVRVDHRSLTHEQKEKRPTVLFTEPEIQTLLSRTTGFWHAAVALAFYAGLRISDITRLEWACLAQPDKVIFWTLKTNTRCVVPLPLVAQQALEHTRKIHERFVFPGEYAMYIKCPSAFSHQFTRLCEDLGFGKRNFHALRHSYVTRMRKNGVTAEEVGSRVGHRNTRTTEIYTHLE